MTAPLWPSRRLELWHPESPGVRVLVKVYWPRSWWLERKMRRPSYDGRFPVAFATNSEVLRRYRELRREWWERQS